MADPALASLTQPGEPPAIRGLHHFAWRCRDAEETRRFYEDLLGLPLVHLIQSDRVPSTGEHCPYTHLFFRLGDGSCIAFFDLDDDTAALPSPNTPAWVNHIALRVDSVEALEEAKARLEAAGHAVLGVTDHRIFQSIYVFDPNGLRLELCASSPGEPELVELQPSARARLGAWSAAKPARRAARAAATQ